MIICGNHDQLVEIRVGRAICVFNVAITQPLVCSAHFFVHGGHSW